MGFTLLEMGNLYDEFEPRLKNKAVECEYAQVRFKRKKVFCANRSQVTILLCKLFFQNVMLSWFFCFVFVAVVALKRKFRFIFPCFFFNVVYLGFF